MSVASITSPGSTGIDDPPGMSALALRPRARHPPSPAARAKGVPSRTSKLPGRRTSPDTGEDLGAAVVGRAELEECLAAVAHDRRHRLGEGISVSLTSSACRMSRKLAGNGGLRSAAGPSCPRAIPGAPSPRRRCRRRSRGGSGAVSSPTQNVVAEQRPRRRPRRAPFAALRRRPRSTVGRSYSHADSPSRRRWRSPCPRSASCGL